MNSEVSEKQKAEKDASDVANAEWDALNKS